MGYTYTIVKNYLATFGRALKHLFIPHEHNDYKPHFFREVSIAIILILSIFLLGVSAGSSFFIHKTVLGANVTASVLIDLTNESRLAYNQSPLLRNPVLDTAATLKAEDMAKEGYFSHNSPSGITPWHWFKEAGYVFLYAGENLAINFTDAQQVRQAWLDSPAHRANLLDVKFKEIGMATVSGLYKDSSTIYVVQMFGTPAKVKELTESASTTPETTTTETVQVASTEETAPVDPKLPQIKGETSEVPTGSAQATSTPTVEIPKEEYEPVVTTTELAIVKNTNNEEVQAAAPVATYSKWYERALFGGSHYIDLAYKALLLLVVAALILMVAIEIRKQHWKHISYGLALLLAITLCILINQAFL